MHFNTLFWIIVIIVVLQFIWSQVLSALNRSRMSDTLPEELVGIYDEAEYARQQQYQRANSKLNLVEQAVMTLVMLAVLFTGTLGTLENALAARFDNEIVVAIAFIAIVVSLMMLISLPFSYYDTFVIEERFGFNKATRPLFMRDTLVNLLLTLVLASVALGVIVFFYQLTPEWFWLWAWAILTFFSVGVNYFYSQLIVPLFNKQTPLEDGELRDSLMDLGERTDFLIEDVYLIDGSKRSTKANAYFTGFGKKKRICLYDTLLEQMDTQEITAVLAHEIGHYKNHHIITGMLRGVAINGFQLWLMSLFLKSPALAEALGSKTGDPSVILGIIAFGMLFGPISELLGLVGNIISRRNEYQADGFAAHYGFANPLIEGLKKISSQALSNLTPHPLVVFWNYSHPTLLQRMHALIDEGTQL
ncbi:MAG: M48 family metallopeptidase [Coriobacteriia bacterium]|nr:M48 family metallopeptidase [Coriobacteriia bacterium]